MIYMEAEDTGIGIPEAEQERVFERFYRVDRSHLRKIGGTGLGLSIVKHGAMLHSAKLSLKSKVGEGTAVRVVF
ncbi:MAG: ATP-binding protein [Oscillospiraceae bacterium]|nr:ATP-binding protein [Oscillospiraceae bacterium]